MVEPTSAAPRPPPALSATRVREALGEPAVPGTADSFAGVSIDSRSLHPGCLFVGLKGERHDGAAFADDAVRAGAVGVVAASHPPAGLPAGVAWWTVDDGLVALHRLAFSHRRAMPARMVCVTGSNGKTATKELTASVLAQGFEVARTPGNLNSLVGLPLSLLELSPEHAWGVFELGSNRAGEIARLAALARPDVAVITNVGPSHLEGLGSVEGVLKEKTDLAAALGREGTLVYGGDGERLRSAVQAFSCPKVSFGMHAENDIHPEWAELDAEGHPVFEVTRLGRVQLQLVGLPNLLNALAAIAVGRLAGLPPAAIRRGLEAVRPMPLRMDVTRVGGVTVIQDCYKADPDSMLRGVETLRAVAREGRRVAVLGGMRELGRDAPRLHYELGRELAREPLDLLVVYGDEALPIARGYQSGTGAPVFLFHDYGRLVRFLEERVQAPASVLFKASRGVALEQAARAYLGDLGAFAGGAGSGAARAGNGAPRPGAG